MPIQGYLFDLDGTLIDSERETAEAMARALARGQSVVVDEDMRNFIIGRSWIAIYDELKTRYSRLTWTRDEVIAQTAQHREEVFAELGLTVLPGALSVLAWTRGTPRALVTGSSRAEAAQALRYLGPDAQFDAVFAAEDVARSKPAPDGYLAGAAAIGVAPAHCLVLEDSVAGIAAGRAAGCVVLAVRAGNFGGWDQSGAHRLIASLDELTPALVEELNRDYGAPMGSPL